MTAARGLGDSGSTLVEVRKVFLRETVLFFSERERFFEREAKHVFSSGDKRGPGFRPSIVRIRPTAQVPWRWPRQSNRLGGSELHSASGDCSQNG